MVHNKNIILDEGQLKNVDEYNNMVFSKRTKKLFNAYKELFNEWNELYTKSLYTGPIGSHNEKLSSQELGENRNKREEIKDNIELMCGGMWRYRNEFLNYGNKRFDVWEKRCMEIIDFEHDIKPITPAIMINISPEKMDATDENIEKFCGGIETYCRECNSSRYEKITYTLENGKNGDHLHAHCVFFINPKQITSVLEGHKWVNGKKKPTSHIGQGKHIRQIKHHLNNEFGGIGIQVQCAILRTEQLIEDKLQYLVHETKCLGHENKSKIMDIKTINFS